jgi:hypothetical protein
MIKGRVVDSGIIEVSSMHVESIFTLLNIKVPKVLTQGLLIVFRGRSFVAEHCPDLFLDTQRQLDQTMLRGVLT